jgi:hypothetical protein
MIGFGTFCERGQNITQKRGGGGIGPKYRPLAKKEFFCGGIVFGQKPTKPGFLFEEKLPF